MGADGHQVDTGEVRGYAGLVERQAQHFTAIEQHARDKGGDTSGYTGLLELLAPVVEGVVSLYSETLEFANGKMTEVRDKLEDAAAKYDEQEESSRSEIETVGSKLDATATPNVGGA